MSEKRRGVSPTQFKKYYSISPPFTLLFLSIHFQTFQLLLLFMLFPPQTLKMEHLNTPTYSLVSLLIIYFETCIQSCITFVHVKFLLI